MVYLYYEMSGNLGEENLVKNIGILLSKHLYLMYVMRNVCEKTLYKVI